MFFANIFKILFIIFLVYSVVNVFKYLIFLNRRAGQKIKNKRRAESGRSGSAGNGKIIELDKDQYKVE